MLHLRLVHSMPCRLMLPTTRLIESTETIREVESRSVVDASILHHSLSVWRFYSSVARSCWQATALPSPSQPYDSAYPYTDNTH